MVLGIVSFVLGGVPFVDYVTIVAALVGLVLGIMALRVPFRPRKAAVAGVVLSSLGLLLSIATAIVFTAAFAAAGQHAAAARVSHTVEYSVTGDAATTTVLSTTLVGGNREPVDEEVALPYSKTFSVTGSGDFAGVDPYHMSAGVGADGTSVTCTITVDGVVVSTDTASGRAGVATCAGGK